jgi:DNA-binding GntR family transcriptional regulator
MTGSTGTTTRGDLSDRAYRQLRDGILRGDLPPGTVLGETELAASLGGSRTPIRHALSRLRQEGLIEVGARRQAIVRGFTPEHRKEMTLLREALERLAVQRACEVMDIREIDELRLLLIRQRRAAAEGDEDQFLELDEQLHLRIAEGARLHIVHGFLLQLRGFVRLAHFGVSRPPIVLEEIVDEHERIVDALEARDASVALRSLSEHLQRSDYPIPAEGR